MTEVVYTEERWRILREKRGKARRVMEPLERAGLYPIVHGSIARGDVDTDSDIDIVVPHPVAPSILLYTLERAGFKPFYIEIVQATPSYTPKVYIHLDPVEEVVVSFPLAELGEREREFYKWGGELSLQGILKGRRVPGVSKELKLIIPTSRGHREEEVEGREFIVARLLGISIATVEERIRVLSKRREHGRTGVFIKQPVDPSTPLESVIQDLARRVPAFRRKVFG